MRSSMLLFLHHHECLVLLTDVGGFHLPAPSGEDGDGLIIIIDELVSCSITVRQPGQHE